jgi:hypothetical protein
VAQDENSTTSTEKFRETAIAYTLLGNGAGLITGFTAIQSYISEQSYPSFAVSALLFLTIVSFALGETLAVIALFIHWNLTSFAQKRLAIKGHTEEIVSSVKEISEHWGRWVRSVWRPENLYKASALAFLAGIWLGVAGLGCVLFGGESYGPQQPCFAVSCAFGIYP